MKRLVHVPHMVTTPIYCGSPTPIGVARRMCLDCGLPEYQEEKDIEAPHMMHTVHTMVFGQQITRTCYGCADPPKD